MANLKMRIEPTDELYTRPAGSKIYQLADAFLKGKFGQDSKTYQTIMSGINLKNATGSSLPFNIVVDQILSQGQRVPRKNDLIKMMANDPNCFSGIYSDTTEVVLYSATPSLDQNKQILGDLVDLVDLIGSERYEAENPLIISGLGITPADNRYGFKFTETDSTKMKNDPRFAYSNNGKEVDFDGTKIKVYTKENGLSRLYAGGGGLGAGGGGFAGSGGGGRVVVVDAEGVDFKE